ncbi:MAG: leucyl/phenylalanyl-tRNA--protein transferase [Spirochaetes bacterium]|nr:leucyl/phenylalanyl-tRNA--protein transferase [Spirochaetota bacterium]
MPIFMLNKEIVFPPVELADEEGILAVGGDLSPERLLAAYQLGIFPWYSDMDPILWWSPDPRFVLLFEDFHVSQSLKKIIRKKTFKITADQAFKQVVMGCRQPRKKQKGTWITDDMLYSYCNLYNLGFAHSIETWLDDELVGGLYGVSLGKCFFGESMFTKASNASKVAFVYLVEFLKKKQFVIIDSQVYTDHLCTFGAKNISRTDYLAYLNRGLEHPTLRGNWNQHLQDFDLHLFY